MNPETYLAPLRLDLETHSNPNIAPDQARYMRNLFPFYGLEAPRRMAIFREFIRKNGLPDDQPWQTVVQYMFTLPEREWQYLALEIAKKYRKKWTESDLELFETLIVTKSWWDSVDAISSDLVGALLENRAEWAPTAVQRWLASGNMWLQRTALIYQRKYKSKTNTEILIRSIRYCKSNNAFFIQKAIGWALRSYSYEDPEWVKTLIQTEGITGLAAREALKAIQRQAQRTDEMPN